MSDEVPAATTLKPFFSDTFIVKVASRCNLDCTYCYWFRDPSVYQQPALMSEEVEDAFINRLQIYAHELQLRSLNIVFHGGEPLLFGIQRTQRFVEKTISALGKHGVNIGFAIQTNAVLVTQEWAKFFSDYNISPSISIDGMQEIHDKHRISRDGAGSFQRTLSGMKILQESGCDVGVLAVCDPQSDPEDLCSFFISTLGLKHFDVLLPDFNWDEKDKVQSVARYYIKLYDLWYDEYSKKGIRIRFVDHLTKSILGIIESSTTVGRTRMATCVVMPDGALQPHDVLRISGSKQVHTGLNVLNNNIDELFRNKLWNAIFSSSYELSQKCQQCSLLDVCGGGNVYHRYSSQSEYNNPSVYCEDYKSIIRHAWHRIKDDLHITSLFADDNLS